MTPERYVRTLYVAWKLLIRGHVKHAFIFADNAKYISTQVFVPPRITSSCISMCMNFHVDNPDSRLRWVRIMESI